MDRETVHTFQPDDGREGLIVQVDKQNAEVVLVVGRSRVVMLPSEARGLMYAMDIAAGRALAAWIESHPPRRGAAS